MKKKNKNKRFIPRLPMEAVETLRHKGGAHSSRKGKKGYNRKRDKVSQNQGQYTNTHLTI